MPLLDHFNPPLSRTHPWRSFHGAWAAAIARLLNQGVLPAGYYAVPLVDRDGPIEIDVAALQDQESSGLERGEVEPRTWTAPDPAVAIAVDLAAVEGVQVQVFADDGDPRLAAAVELLRPRNKDRPAVAYRAVGRDEGLQQLEVWPAPLALGQPLPTLLLWIASDYSVPLDLEASYQMTCADLRISGHSASAAS
jgi:hypothetical protein